MSDDTFCPSPQIQRLVSREISEYVVTHPGRSQYSQTGGGAAACGVAALNCARIVLGLHSSGLGTAQLMEELMKRKFLEGILQPCLSWSSTDHLSAEDIYNVPIFLRSLKRVDSHYGQAGFTYFEELLLKVLERTKLHSISTCVIITRPPEIIACFCLSEVPGELFVIFDSHPRPDTHPEGAAFIFKNSVKSTAHYLANLLYYDERLLSDSSVQWQAQLLAHCSGEIFVARRGGTTSSQWGEIALEASLQVLKLQASVKTLETKNEGLEEDKKRLNDEVTCLEYRLVDLQEEHETLKKKYEQLASKPQNGRNMSYSSIFHQQTRQRPLGTPTMTQATAPTTGSFPKNGILQTFNNVPVDNLQRAHDHEAACQLQRQYNQEDRELQCQIRLLQATEPKFFDCGICFERFQDDYLARVTPCDHSYCRSCLRKYAESRIDAHSYPIACPTCAADKNPAKQGEIGQFALQQLGLDERRYEIYHEMQMAAFSIIIHCRKCKQTIFVDKSEYDEAQEIVCPLRGCGYAWCKTCSQPIQIGGPKHSCDGSNELNHLMAQRGWKPCPGCKTPAEKTDGCNHMTCVSPGCNTHFCYRCGQLIVKSITSGEIRSAVQSHYQACTLF